MWRALTSLNRPLSTAVHLPASHSWWACVTSRSIITVTVPQPSVRQGEASREAYWKEVDKCEGIALANFNRLVREEFKRGVIPGGPRYRKRFARFVKPTKQRQLAGVVLRTNLLKAAPSIQLQPGPPHVPWFFTSSVEPPSRSRHACVALSFHLHPFLSCSRGSALGPAQAQDGDFPQLDSVPPPASFESLREPPF